MRAMLALAGCTKATASWIGDRTLRIEGPGLPSGSTETNRCVAERVCPKGYRGLKELERRNTSDGPRSEEGIFTNCVDGSYRDLQPFGLYRLFPGVEIEPE